MISDEQKRKVKEKAATELKKYVAIALYLWVLFSLFEIHRFAVLREFHLGSVSGYRIGFAAINALIIAKVILIGEAFHFGENLGPKSVFWFAVFKSVIFAGLTVSFEIVEEVITGLIHGKSIVASIPEMGGGGLEGVILAGIMAAVALFPFFLFVEMQQALGKEQLHVLLQQKRSRADAA